MAPGKRSRLNDVQRRALVETVERGPIPAIHGVVRWRLIDLVQWLHQEFAVSLDPTTVGRELNRLRYIKLTTRPRHHAQNELAIEAFKKGRFAAELAKVSALLPKGTPLETWFQDKARVGQTNKITLRWARRDTRLSASKGRRTKSACIFSSIRPELGKGGGLVLPFCHADTMSLHLGEIALAIAVGAHAVGLMDQAGWHMTGKLIPPNHSAADQMPRGRASGKKLAVHAR